MVESYKRLSWKIVQEQASPDNPASIAMIKSCGLDFDENLVFMAAINSDEPFTRQAVSASGTFSPFSSVLKRVRCWVYLGRFLIPFKKGIFDADRSSHISDRRSASPS